MAATIPGARRRLSFDSWDDVLSDLDALERGNRQIGAWDLSQVCLHLADWLQFPVQGFPPARFPLSILLPILRHTVGPRQLRSILTTGQFPTGGPTFPQTVHPPHAQPHVAAQRLRAAISAFREHSGEYLPSPVFGVMDRPTVDQLQRTHCAHHFGFLMPY